MTIHVFGIRHHGPGCARSLSAALEELQPDIIVMEAPADGQPALEFAARSELRPPVAMLIYPPDQPGRSVIYPLALFSPEWQTLRWGAEHRVPIRAMDLPLMHRMAMDAETLQEAEAPRSPEDPISLLAEAAGYKDHELWWEEQIERRRDPTGLFEAIATAMRTLREEFPEVRAIDLLREAFMRKTLRGVLKEGFQRIAVVCGAWHAPVLDEDAVAGRVPGLRVKDDNDRLKKLPKVKTVSTWIPWTSSRLTYRSGYGAGIESPGWYAHLWESQEDGPTRWIASAARLLRQQDLSASAANVVEAQRLAETLAALRERRAPGLIELNEALQTVFCHGDAAPLRLIRQRLEVGDEIGSVPDESIAVPLAQDLARLQKSLRLKPSTLRKRLDLDLRQETGRERSWLLHRLRVLGIAWGTIVEDDRSVSTFHELWDLEWEPEFAIRLIEGNVWGNTVEEAATARLGQQGAQTTVLSELTVMLDTALLANLQLVVPALLHQIQSTAAVATDVMHLMEAMQPLARVARYGDVRQTQAAQVEPILVGMAERIFVGLPSACSTLSEEAANRIVTAMASLQSALSLLSRPELLEEWFALLHSLAQSEEHGLLRGWCCRTLLEQGEIGPEELDQLTRRALSAAEPTPQAAAWISGLLRGSGLLLVHQEVVWSVMDEWLRGLSAESFVETLPLVRRAFSDFTPAERRQMGERVKRLSGSSSAPRSMKEGPASIDHARADKVLPVLAQILGVDYES